MLMLLLPRCFAADDAAARYARHMIRRRYVFRRCRLFSPRRHFLFAMPMRHY